LRDDRGRVITVQNDAIISTATGGIGDMAGRAGPGAAVGCTGVIGFLAICMIAAAASGLLPVLAVLASVGVSVYGYILVHKSNAANPTSQGTGSNRPTAVPERQAQAAFDPPPKSHAAVSEGSAAPHSSDAVRFGSIIDRISRETHSDDVVLSANKLRRTVNGLAASEYDQDIADELDAIISTRFENLCDAYFPAYAQASPERRLALDETLSNSLTRLNNALRDLADQQARRSEQAVAIQGRYIETRHPDEGMI
jgi:hypothetical protein